MGGMGPGQDPFGHRDDVPHFDRVAHERTHRRADERRARRRAAAARSDRPVRLDDSGLITSFVIISGVVVSAFLAKLAIFGS